MFKSLSHIENKKAFQFFELKKKVSVLWVISSTKKKTNSLSLFIKKKKSSILWALLSKKSSILWVIFSKGSILEGHITKIYTILSVKLKQKKRFNPLSHIQFFESCWKKVSVLWVVFLKQINSLIQKMFQFFESFVWKEGSILWIKKKVQFLWVIFLDRKKKFNSLRSNKTKGSISLSHVKKEGSILYAILKRCQFFESYFSKVIFYRRGSSRWVM